MSPRKFPDYLNNIWVKSPADGESEGESLPRHTWNVLEQMSAIAYLRPNLATSCEEPRLWHRLFWACWLHDTGKSASGFQSMLKGGPRWNGWRHEILSLAFADWLFPPDHQDRRWVMAAIGTHHKDHEDIKGYIEDQDTLEKMVNQVPASSVAGIWLWLSEYAAPWRDELDMAGYGVELPTLPDCEEALQSFYTEGPERIRAAVKEFDRWVKPSVRQTPLTAVQMLPHLLMRGYIMQADHTASAHAVRLPRADFSSAGLRERWRIRGVNADYDHQEKCEQRTGSAILSAPTGSGKTEAALLWAAKQADAASGLPRLFYTLPYQASMNAMYKRLVTDSFPKPESQQYELVGLQHGRGLLALYRSLMDKGYTRQEASREARMMKNLARLNLPPVRVFSPYQMLKGFYRLKGYETLLADYYGAAFIFDEIHAYEAVRLALILKSVEHLAKHYDARFLFMSATFPSLIRQKLRDTLGLKAKDEIVAAKKLFRKFQRHLLRLRDGEVTAPEVVAEIQSRVGEGQLVLVCVNIVQRAQDLYGQLARSVRATGGEAVLLHGRFNGRDRLEKEKIIREAAGADSTSRRPLLVIATQAIEVSLDINLDVLFSDPAPLEALIQRFGRINRRPQEGKLAEVFVFREPSDGQGIYGELLIAATLRILDREKNKPVNESKVSTWLDEIYKGEIAADWLDKYEQAADLFEEVCVKTLKPFQSDKEVEQRFYKLFDGVEVLPLKFEREYRELEQAGRLVEASELLVSVSYGQYMSLLKRGKLKEQEEKWLKLANVPYSSELGLRLKEDGSDDE